MIGKKILFLILITMGLSLPLLTENALDGAEKKRVTMLANKIGYQIKIKKSIILSELMKANRSFPQLMFFLLL